jgi:hypothetical protein
VHFRWMHSALSLLICTTKMLHGFELIYVASHFAKWENLLCEIFCNMLGICFCFREQSHIPCLVTYCSCPFGEKEFATLCLSVELMCWPLVSPQERIFFKDTLMQVGALSCMREPRIKPTSSALSLDDHNIIVETFFPKHRR